MKPRRTFESVVSELVEGFDSGEVILDQSNRKGQFSSKASVRFDTRGRTEEGVEKAPGFRGETKHGKAV